MEELRFTVFTFTRTFHVCYRYSTMCNTMKKFSANHFIYRDEKMRKVVFTFTNTPRVIYSTMWHTMKKVLSKHFIYRDEKMRKSTL